MAVLKVKAEKDGVDGGSPKKGDNVKEDGDNEEYSPLKKKKLKKSESGGQLTNSQNLEARNSPNA